MACLWGVLVNIVRFPRNSHNRAFAENRFEQFSGIIIIAGMNGSPNPATLTNPDLSLVMEKFWHS